MLPLPPAGPMFAFSCLILSSHHTCMDLSARQHLKVPKTWIRVICPLTPASISSSAGLSCLEIRGIINF